MAKTRHTLMVFAIIALSISANVQGHSEKLYGPVLPIVHELRPGAAMAVRVVGQSLYIIGYGKLRVADISEPAKPKILGTLDGLGNARQIVVKNGIAYITSREDGVFIVDVKQPDKPKLLCHYDPIEVATGIDVSGNIMFVGCRSHGVELVDVTNPKKPLHLSTVRTGESQSVVVRNGFAYVGVWGSSQLVVADVRNPREPHITARCRLDGYGDGVAVRGRHVYAATGHHSRERRPGAPQGEPKEGEPGYGAGHGLEIFDISDPAKPVFVSRVKCPPFYRLGPDMWSVKVAGDYAFVADTHNGVFVVNVKDPRKPFFVGHCQLPVPSGKELPGYVGGLDVTTDYIYVAGAQTALHVVEAKGLAVPVEPEPDNPPTIPPLKERTDARFRIYRPDGQVRGVALLDDVAVLACGSDGIHLVQLSPALKRLNRYETESFAMSVAVSGKNVFVAEEKGGLSIWRESGKGALTPLGRYKPRSGSVRDVVVPPPGKYAILQVGLNTLDILDVSNPRSPKSVFQDTGHGFLYHLSESLMQGKLLCVLWQIGGLRWYDLYGGPQPTFTGGQYGLLRTRGVVALGDKWLAVVSNGLGYIETEETRLPSQLGIVPVAKQPLKGRPQLYGNKLYLSDREFGNITVIDVSDPKRPVLLEQFNVPGNPGRLALHNNLLFIPNGYEGLWVADQSRAPLAGAHGAKMPMIRLASTPSEIWRIWGEANKRAIVHNMDIFYLKKAAEEGISEETLLERGKTFLHIAQEVAPHWLEEARAIAQAAGARGDLYLSFLAGALRGLSLHECTSYSVPRQYTRGDAILFHKTRDNKPAEQTAYILESSPPDLQKFIPVCDAGRLHCCMMVNDQGLAGSADYPGGLRSPNTEPRYRGMMNGAILRYIAERASTCSEALRIIKDFVKKGYCAGGKVNATHWLFVDREGVILEVSNNSEHVVSQVHTQRVHFSKRETSAAAKRLREAKQPIDFHLFHCISRDPSICLQDSISSMTVEIEPSHPGLVTCAWVSLPAHAGSFPLLMAQSKTPACLLNGDAYLLGTETRTNRSLWESTERGSDLSKESLKKKLVAARAREATDLANRWAHQQAEKLLQLMKTQTP